MKIKYILENTAVYQGDIKIEHPVRRLTFPHSNPAYKPGEYAVAGNFDCSYTMVGSLQGGPSVVEGDFNCSSSKIQSLEGGPTIVKGNYDCSYLEISSLKGAPQVVGKTFDCSLGHLTSLVGGPTTVRRDYKCNHNPLTSLEGVASRIGGNLHCQFTHITSLVGISDLVQSIGGGLIEVPATITEGAWGLLFIKGLRRVFVGYEKAQPIDHEQAKIWFEVVEILNLYLNKNKGRSMLDEDDILTVKNILTVTPEFRPYAKK